jgi:predicted metal-dependent enzyme (double-stranded beta helix superfamily)
VNATLAGLDDPVRTLFEDIAGPASAVRPDLEAIGRALVDLATNDDYMARWVERLGDRPGALAMHVPVRGPRLMIVHRPEGGLSAVHDHGTWVAVATIVGTETHRRYRAGSPGSTSPLQVVEQRDLAPADVATLVPPDDIHDHGHLVGHGQPAHILVMTGDDQTVFTRREWNLATGRQRVLRPGDGGRWLASEPMPGA